MFCSKMFNSTLIRNLIVEEGRSRIKGCRAPPQASLSRKISSLNRTLTKLKTKISSEARTYSMCCGPPKGFPDECGCPGQRPIVPPPDCKPGPLPPNPCCPVFHQANYKKYKYIFYFVCLPLIIVQMFIALGNCPKPKTVCREYDYMLRRNKRFPWGDGTKTFFHNDHVNHLPGDCMPPPLICEDD